MQIDIKKVKVNRTFSLPLTVVEELKQYASNSKQDMSYLVGLAIVDMLKSQEKK